MRSASASPCEHGWRNQLPNAIHINSNYPGGNERVKFVDLNAAGLIRHGSRRHGTGLARHPARNRRFVEKVRAHGQLNQRA